MVFSTITPDSTLAALRASALPYTPEEEQRDREAVEDHEILSWYQDLLAERRDQPRGSGRRRPGV